MARCLKELPVASAINLLEVRMLSLNTIIALKTVLNSDRIQIGGHERAAFNQIEAELSMAEATLRAAAAQQKEKTNADPGKSD